MFSLRSVFSCALKHISPRHRSWTSPEGQVYGMEDRRDLLSDITCLPPSVLIRTSLASPLFGGYGFPRVHVCRGQLCSYEGCSRGDRHGKSLWLRSRPGGSQHQLQHEYGMRRRESPLWASECPGLHGTARRKKYPAQHLAESYRYNTSREENARMSKLHLRLYLT